VACGKLAMSAGTSGAPVAMTAEDRAQPNVDPALLDRMYSDLGLYPSRVALEAVADSASRACFRAQDRCRLLSEPIQVSVDARANT
jgi:hypothetical protein